MVRTEQTSTLFDSDSDSDLKGITETWRIIVIRHQLVYRKISLTSR